MTQDKERKILATLLTLLVVAGAGVAILLTSLHYQYPPEDPDELAMFKQDSIVFGGEWVQLGETLEPLADEPLQPEVTEENNEETAPKNEGEHLKDAGVQAKETAPTVTSKEPSPMQVKEKPKPKEPTGPPRKTEEELAQEKAQREAAEAAKNRTKNAFGNATGNKGSQGSPDGNADSGNLTGRGSTEGLVGFTVASWGRPHSRYAGSVKVDVRVNSRGKVIEAKAVSGTGEAWRHNEVRQSCVQESLKSQFSVRTDRTTDGRGYINWIFK